MNDREALLLSPKGVLRFRDYGQARIFDPAHRVAIDPTVLPRWYHSELTRNARASRQADLWSLGAVAYYLLTGIDVEHDGRKRLATVRSGLDPKFCEVIERCLEPFGDVSYQSVEELLDDLCGRTVTEEFVPQRLATVPARIDFDRVAPGEVALGGFRIVNEGGGTLAGHVHTMSPWIQFSPQHFEGNDCEVQVWVDSTALGHNAVAQGDLYVTSANEEVKLPVRIALALDTGTGMKPALAGLLMVLLVALPLGVLTWFNVSWLLIAHRFLAARPHHAVGDMLPGLLYIRKIGTLLLALRCTLAVGAPLLAYLVWRRLGVVARRRAGLVAIASMLSPLFVQLVAVKVAEGTFATDRMATWLRLSPDLCLGMCALGSLSATLLVLLPHARFPDFLRGRGMRFVCAFLLLVLYGWNSYLAVVGFVSP